jgi:hypothetical protein
MAVIGPLTLAVAALSPMSAFELNGLNSDIAPCPLSADSVAKVVLQKMSKILRAAGAVFV